MLNLISFGSLFISKAKCKEEMKKFTIYQTGKKSLQMFYTQMCVLHVLKQLVESLYIQHNFEFQYTGLPKCFFENYQTNHSGVG